MTYIIVFTTTPNKKVARKICQTLVKKSLAACTQIIGPIQSHYIWQHRLEQTKEFLCLIKTRANQYKKVEKLIKSMHPYQIPEIVGINIVKGFMPYLNWVNTQII
ncbi:MAG: divalent-cation tolerance protein CutA [Candidatus Latescibacteria bacterium]|nr:divalent-cation tolerance protein CutA [Candidatus Latescibacterota bacterium]